MAPDRTKSLHWHWNTMISVHSVRFYLSVRASFLLDPNHG